jgi:hypothetical protein
VEFTTAAGQIETFPHEGREAKVHLNIGVGAVERGDYVDVDVSVEETGGGGAAHCV